MMRLILPSFDGITNEKQFQRQVEEISALAGYQCAYHTKYSIGSDPGFPDLALFNPRYGGAVFLECKVGRNRPTDKQKMWLYDLRCAGFHAYVAHPSSMRVIADVLVGMYDPPEIGTGKPSDDALDVVCHFPDFTKGMT